MKKNTVIILGLALLLSTSSSALAANEMTERLKGRLLLQVEDRGRIWYVDPVGEQKHEVTFVNALHLFETLSLGISNADLYKIPMHIDSASNEVDTDGDGFSDKSEVAAGYNPEIASDPNNRGNDRINHDTNLADRLKGKLLLQVEDRGRIWYVDIDGKRHEVTWKNLMDLFRRLSLGITNSDLGEIGGSSDNGIKIVSESYWGFVEDVDLYHEQGNDKYKEIYPCDNFYTAEQLEEKGKGAGLSLTINNRMANKYYSHGQIVEISEQSKNNMIANNITNTEIININGDEIVFELIEAHSEDLEPRKTLCTYDGQYCEDEHDWAIFKINGYETELVREEIKTFVFDNGLIMNFALSDDDVDICLKIIK